MLNFHNGIELLQMLLACNYFSLWHCVLIWERDYPSFYFSLRKVNRHFNGIDLENILEKKLWEKKKLLILFFGPNFVYKSDTFFIKKS